jgi:hypothetical protein
VMSISGRCWRVDARRRNLMIACRRLGIRTLSAFLDAVERRATSERQLCEGVYGDLLNILQPPGCQKTHCKHHSVFGFASCLLNRTPGRCKEHREYLERRRKREAAKLAKEGGTQ